jgi:hypothetical protein
MMDRIKLAIKIIWIIIIDFFRPKRLKVESYDPIRDPMQPTAQEQAEELEILENMGVDVIGEFRIENN